MHQFVALCSVVRLLLKKGADIEARDRYGRTALVSAVNGGKPQVVDLLLGQGAEVNPKRAGRATIPLMQAVTLGASELSMYLDEQREAGKKVDYNVLLALHLEPGSGPRGGFGGPKALDPPRPSRGKAPPTA